MRAIALASLCVLVSGCFAARGLWVQAGLGPARSPEALSLAIRPYDEWFVPEGEGPFPVVVIAPGCLGTREHQREWARFFVEDGIAALIVDSFVPRGYAEVESREAVCEGEDLWGFVRAGDLWVTLSDLAWNPRIDPERVVLAGWSNGGWAVLDALAMDPEEHPPPTLSPVPRRGLDGVRGAVFLYPYCGFGTAPAARGWSQPVPALMLLAGEDENVSRAECEATADELRGAGVPIEVGVLEGATHWFDHDGDFELVAHRFDGEALEEARTRVRAFLSGAFDGDASRPSLSGLSTGAVASPRMPSGPR